MNNLEGFNQNDILEIYRNVVSYSIYLYHELPEESQKHYEEKYKNALIAQQILGIETLPEKEDIKNFLSSIKDQVNEMQIKNQPFIDLLADKTRDILINEMPKDLTSQEKIEYVFDYITNTMEFSNEWYNYSFKVPPTNGFDFSFYHGVPLSSSFKGLLITRQGVCDDFTNIMMILGRDVGLNIKKMVCRHNGNLHAINYVELGDGTISLLDPTSVIQKAKAKEDACLVSKEILNKNNDYDFSNNQNFTSTALPKSQKTTYNIEKIIERTSYLLPSVEYVEIQKERFTK